MKGDEYSCEKVCEEDLGESWLQVLAETDFRDVSVEDRLRILELLVASAMESGTLRAALEERHEAIEALRQHIRFETRLERRRQKEELMAKLQAIAVRNNAVNGDPLQLVPEAASGGVTDDVVSSQTSQGKVEGGELEPLIVTGEGTSAAEAEATAEADLAADKAVAILKESLAKGEAMYEVRKRPLGRDRRWNTYWLLTPFGASSEDPNLGRIYFQSVEDGAWRVIDEEEDLDRLLGALNPRGAREAVLHASLKNIESILRVRMRAAVSGATRTKNLISNSGIEPEEIFHPTISGDQPEQVPQSIDRISSAIELKNNDLKKSCVRFHEWREWVSATPTRAHRGEYAQKRRLAHLKDEKRDISTQLASTQNASYRASVVQVGSSEGFGRCNECQEILVHEEELHCPYCHQTWELALKSFDWHTEHLHSCKSSLSSSENMLGRHSQLPLPLKISKAAIMDIEYALPPEAVQEWWMEGVRSRWLEDVKRAMDSLSLLKALAELEAAVHQEWRNPCFESTKDTLERISSGGSQLFEDSSEMEQVLPWVPCTPAAVSLRAFTLDHALKYHPEETGREEEEEETLTKLEFPKLTPVEDLANRVTRRGRRKKKLVDSSEDEGQPDAVPVNQVSVVPIVGGRGSRGSRGGRGGRGRGMRGRSSKLSSPLTEVHGMGSGALNTTPIIPSTRGGRGRGRGRGRGGSSGRGRGSTESGRGRGGGRGRGKAVLPPERVEKRLLEKKKDRVPVTERHEEEEEDSSYYMHSSDEEGREGRLKRRLSVESGEEEGCNPRLSILKAPNGKRGDPLGQGEEQSGPLDWSESESEKENPVESDKEENHSDSEAENLSESERELGSDSPLSSDEEEAVGQERKVEEPSEEDSEEEMEEGERGVPPGGYNDEEDLSESGDDDEF